MSSFRPDPALLPAVFRPSASGARGHDGFRPEAGLAGRSLESLASALPSCTAEVHAALEQAAFLKGQQSAEVDWARCEKACRVFEAAAASLSRASVSRLHVNRDAMLELAAEIARHWLGEELRLDPTRFAGPLDRALALCAGAPRARIRLHPEVIGALESSLPDWLARWSETLEVELSGDADLAPGAFRIETETQTVDAGFDTLASRLREALTAALEAPQPEPVSC